MEVKKIFLLLLVFFSIHLSQDFHYDLLVKDYNIYKYIDDYYIKKIVQGQSGYLYFITSNHFFRFDGIDFEDMSFLLGETGKLEDLLIDKQGNLYIAFDSTLIGIKDSLGNYVRFMKKNFSEQLNCLFLNEDNGIWILCHKAIYYYKNDQFQGPAYFSELSPRVKSVNKTNDNELLVATSKNLYLIKDVFSKSPEIKLFLKKSINKIVKTEIGEIWLCGFYCLYLYDNNQLKEFEILFQNANDFLFNSNNDRLICSNNGLYKIRNNKISRMNLLSDLNEETIQSIFEDKEGNIWLGRKGYITKITRSLLRKINIAVDGEKLIINDIDFMPNSSKILLSCSEGLVFYDQGTLTKLIFQMNDHKTKFLTSLIISSNQMLLGTSTGLYMCDLENNQVKRNQRLIKNEIIIDIEKDKDDSFWIVSWNKGLYHLKKNKLELYNQSQGIPIKRYRSVWIDSSGGVWIGGIEGFAYYNGTEFIPFSKEDGFSYGGIWDFNQNPQGVMEIISDSGIITFTPTGLKEYKHEPHGVILTTHRNGNLIYYIRNEFFQFQEGKSARLLSLEEIIKNYSKAKSCAVDSNNYLWIGMKGILYNMDLSLYDLKEQSSHLYLRKIEVNGKVKKDITELKYNENNIRFSLTMIDLTNPEQVRFKYRIRNYQEEWVKTTDRDISIYKLSPGKYVFEALGYNNDGLESANALQQEFTISSPFWETPIFYFFILFQFIILLTSLFFFLNNISLKKSNLVIARTKEELQRSERRYRAIVQDQTELIFRYHRDGTMIFVNEAFCRFFNVMEKDLMNTKFHPPMPPKEFEKFQRSLRQLDKENRIATNDFLFLKGTEERWLQVTSRLIYDDKNHSEIQSVALDITKRIENERKIQKYIQELNELNKELSQYIYIASHDLKAPLYAIHNYIDFLQEDLSEKIEAEQKEYIENMQDAVKEAERMVTDILEYSKLDKNNVNLQKLNTLDFFKEMVETFYKPLNSVLSMEGEWPIIYTDPGLLKQALLNLIANGFKFNKSEKKEVVIQGEKRNARFLIHVKDNGIGIKKRYYNQIFGMFERLHSQEEFEGTGIGLAIVKKVCLNLKGNISVSSNRMGSVFTINIPIKPKLKIK